MNNQERLDMLKGEWSQGIPWAEESKKWLLWQAERVDELEAKYSRLEESFKKQTTNAFDGWEKVIELEKENEEYEQALEFGIKYLQGSDIGQVQIVVQAMKEALGGNKNE